MTIQDWSAWLYLTVELSFYKRVARAYLPLNIRLRRPYKQRAALRGRHRREIVAKQRHGFGSNILKFAKKIAKTPVVRELG